MAEAGELCRWEIVQTVAEIVDDADTKVLADWAGPVQREHVGFVPKPSLTLAADEARAIGGLRRV